VKTENVDCVAENSSPHIKYYNRRLHPSMTIQKDKRNNQDKNQIEVPKFKTSPTIKICTEWIEDDEMGGEELNEEFIK
jgi:hypothetical protein